MERKESMRLLKVVALVAMCVLGMSVLLSAGQNKYGVADNRQVSFDNPIRVGDVLLPSGEYQVLHTMEGENHIMVFKQLRTRKPAEARVKCQLVPLEATAPQTEKIYIVNQSNERVLQTLIFRGDKAKHVF
jgi:hypothetical protein